MELIPLLIVAVIAFNIVRGFSKTASKSGESSREIMARMHKQIQQANNPQNRTPNMSRYQNKTPTQRGRESMAAKGQSPWGETNTPLPGAQIAANYLKKTQKVRKASHKSPVQHGRRGANKDQNRNRTDEWGQRGDSGFLNGKSLTILLVIGGAILYVLSRLPAA